MLNGVAIEDPRGVPISGTSGRCAETFETALRQLQSYRGDPVATIDNALADDPVFVLGHSLRAEICITVWERSVLPDVRVGLPIVRAIDAFGRERYSETVELLLPVRYRAHAFGGSHAQRDVVHRTLIEAAIRSGRRPLARALATERTMLKPHCPFSWSLRRRAES